MLRLTLAVALAFVASAAAEGDGWTGYAGPGFQPTPRAEAAVTIAVTNSAAEDEPAPTPADPIAGAPGPPGPQGPKGDTGEKGDTGPAGVSADLCQNIPGVQSTPGRKYNAQRYWRFKPKWEMRFLVINRKGQLVCVTQTWINRHYRGLR